MFLYIGEMRDRIFPKSEEEFSMQYVALENQLKAHIKRRRTLEAILCGVFLALAIFFGILREQSKVVEEIAFGPIQYEIVTYKEGYGFGIGFGFCGLTLCGIYLLMDHMMSKVVSFDVNEDHITFYRGIFHTNLYVNGECADRVVFNPSSYYLEAGLSDGSTVTAALGKWSAHITFSNGHIAVDV
jgi:hypothetical protein